MTHRLHAVALTGLVLTAAAAAACAGRAPKTDPSHVVPHQNGYRALFRVEAEGPEEKRKFKMAVALVPPDRLRLEFFGPVGGPRMVVALDRNDAVALLPRDRTFDVGEASTEAMDRVLGIPLDAPRLVALLTGAPMCRTESIGQEVQTKQAATFGRTISWYEITCPPNDVRYKARCKERGGILEEATVREGISGDMILEIDYDDHEDGLGPRWPRRIKLHLARRATTVTLEAVEGPTASDVPQALFAPPIPDGFERRSLLASLPAPGLLGSYAGRE